MRAHAGEAAVPIRRITTRVWIHQPTRASVPSGTENSSIAIDPPGRRTRASSRTVAAGIVHVPQEVGEGHGVERIVAEGEPLGLPEDGADPVVEPGEPVRLPPRTEHRLALVQRHHANVLPGRERTGDQLGSRRDVQHARAGNRVRPRHEEPAPARVLAEGQQRAHPFVLRGDAREEPPREPCAVGGHGADLDRPEEVRHGREGVEDVIGSTIVTQLITRSDTSPYGPGSP